MTTTTETDTNAETARRALEVACAGKEPGAIDEIYAETFVDRVNSMEYRGTDGARRSVALYLELFPDLEFVVDEQVTEGTVWLPGGPFTEPIAVAGSSSGGS